ncbi:MAG: BON domain-containing protein [Archangium sp.]|nr:BON domain-containing protein [Archangium sp.]
MRNHVLKALVVGAALLAVPALADTPDGLITSKTKLSLWTTAGVKSTAVHVDTNDGVVTLYGKVPTEDQRSLAERTAMQISGVHAVKNLLQVVPAGDEDRTARTDKDTKASVEKALKADASLKNSKINVKSVDKGVVLLTGEARSFSDHLWSVAVVDRVPGVRRVISEVKGPEVFGNDERFSGSKPSSKPTADARTTASDMRISTAVKLRLFTAAAIPSTEISVDTDDGVVTLFGMVPTVEVKRAAELEAGKASGVRRIENQLEVVPTLAKKVVEAKDADITRDLSLAFKDRAELKGVDSAVKNGVVRLTGTVSSTWDEVTAVRVARQVSGVRSVEDQLKVDDKAPSETSRLD